ncbi:MAG TPA: pentapeptide repeat-containing protein [Streptosporangiaceae bacterium]|nr:pentapeptide repeat-containing protein [Streptosporangiaceae bacterium]
MQWTELADLPFAAALQIHRGGLAPAEAYECAHFDQLDLYQPDAAGSRFLECAFTRVSIQEGQLRRARFADVWLCDVRLISTTLAESGWEGAEITGSVAAGAEAFAARLRRVSLRGCKLDSVNFRDAVLADVTFDNCVLSDVDFSGAALTRVVFRDSRLTRTNFTRVTMDEVDLRGAELGITVDPTCLRGAIVTTAQLMDLAPLLAGSMGLTVADG